MNRFQKLVVPVVVAAAVLVCAGLANVLVQLHLMAHSLAEVCGQLGALHQMNQKLDVLA